MTALSQGFHVGLYGVPRFCGPPFLQLPDRFEGLEDSGQVIGFSPNRRITSRCDAR
jgi:hypothetical protein